MVRVQQFVSAILAGFMIGIGGTVFLSLSNPIVGSFFFGIGLFTVISFQLQLYTGRVGYLPFQKPEYLIELLVTWLGNFVGTFIIAQMVRHTRLFADFSERVNAIVELKFNDTLPSIFILSIFCGVLMFIAIDVFRNTQGSTLRFAAIVLPVMVFILGGFEHVIANLYYISLAGFWNAKVPLYLLVMTLGNSIGGMIFPLFLKAFKLR